MKPMIFDAYIDGLKIVKSQNLAKITLAVDRAMIPPDVWAELAQCDLAEDKLLAIAIMSKEDAKTRAGEITNEKEPNFRQQFYLGFIKDNKRFREYLVAQANEGASAPEITCELEAKQFLKDWQEVTSMTELSKTDIDTIVKEFNEWLSEQ